MLRHFITHRMLYAHLMSICCLLLLLPSVASAKIVFKSLHRGRGYDIYVMEDDGSNVQRLTFSPHSDTAPTWSPDGKHIVFSRNVSLDRKRQQYNLFLINQDGSNEQRLTDHPALKGHNALDGGCTWASDGRRIAFSSNRSGDSEIHIIDIVTRKIRQLTRVGWATSPSWSPDGKNIAYEHVPPQGGTRTIYVMSANGKRTHPLIPSDDRSRYDPSWSPDSKSVLYFETLPGVKGRFSRQVVIQKYNPNTGRGGTRQVLDIPKGWLVNSPCWMDNGRQVLITAKDLDAPNPQFDIYRYDLSSGVITNLTNSPADDYSPHWISDNVLSVTPLGKKTQWGALKK